MGLSDCWIFSVLLVLPDSIKHINKETVMIWHYVNKTELILIDFDQNLLNTVKIN